MKTKIYSLLLLFAFALVGCASTESRIKTWTGHSINEAIAAMGAPTSTYDRGDGGKVHTWVHKINVGSNCQYSLITNKWGTINSYSTNCP